MLGRPKQRQLFLLFYFLPFNNLLHFRCHGWSDIFPSDRVFNGSGCTFSPPYLLQLLSPSSIFKFNKYYHNNQSYRLQGSRELVDIRLGGGGGGYLFHSSPIQLHSASPLLGWWITCPCCYSRLLHPHRHGDYLFYGQGNIGVASPSLHWVVG